MAHLGTLRDYRFEDQAEDIRGAALYGSNDEKLGKIDDVIFDHSTADLKYVVVDTGGWLSSKQFLVPADRIRPRGNKDDEYIANLTKKQVETFPAYDEDTLNDDKRWREYERDYRRASGYEDDGVLHQAGSTNILVPDSVVPEGPAPTTRRGGPASGYKSPIQHREVDMMDTTPTGVAQNPDADRLKFVPNAIGVDRGDIKDKDIGIAAKGESADSARQTPESHIVNREDDRLYSGDRGKEISASEQTIEGDAIFNNEDIAGRTHQRGNVHDADLPSYSKVGGPQPQASQGRLPNYPDASQGRRWGRFEENLRRQRPKIVGHCTACDELRNSHKEDAA